MKLYGVEIASRLLLGTAQYPSPAILADAVRAAKVDIVTVSLRRESGRLREGQDFWTLVQSLGIRVLPNTAGCHSVKEAVTTARMAREIFAQAAFQPYRGEEREPGAQRTSKADVEAWIRNRSETIYHPVGTCKMGPTSDAGAVVDTQMRVRGIEGLRVVDASVMPTLIGGNTNAPTIMIAERTADLIRGTTMVAAA